MSQITAKIREVSGCDTSNIADDILLSSKPVVLRGFVRDWPVVEAGLSSPEGADQYLRSFYNGASVTVTCGEPDIEGYVSYTDDMTQPNVRRQHMPLGHVFDLIKNHAADTKPPLYYVASTDIEACLPGFSGQNKMSLAGRQCLESIWIGNKSRIPAHYDLPDNIACVAVGRRRFTLFPPEQLRNLYVGPLDMTPAGQPISVVDFHDPDFEKYPQYRKALEAAQVAELEPGDAIFIPSMWWHQVEALSSLNVLVNYWWRQSPAYMGPPNNVLQHAIMTIRDLPPAQKQAWKEIFDHYVFENSTETVAHLPAEKLGVLGPMDDTKARAIRAFLLNGLNR